MHSRAVLCVFIIYYTRERALGTHKEKMAAQYSLIYKAMGIKNKNARNTLQRHLWSRIGHEGKYEKYLSSINKLNDFNLAVFFAFAHTIDTNALVRGVVNSFNF